MRLRNIIVLVSGLGVFAAGTVAGILAVANRHSPFHMALWGITAAILLLTGFEFFHYAFSSRDKGYRFLSRGLRGLFFYLAHILLAIGMTLGTMNYQRASDPLCGRDLGAGFPVAFLCDALGESPISDWGKISWTDIPNPLGAFVDILFFAALLWIISFIAIRIIHQIYKRIQFRR